MATLSTKLPAPPQSSWPEMPLEWRRYFMVIDSMIRALNSSFDYSALSTADTDIIATKISERPQTQRLVMRVLSFADVSLTAPPGGETDGALYFVNGVGTGAWATYDNNVMLYDSAAYTALGTLDPGQLAWDEATEVMWRASNDGTIARLAPTAQTIVNDIQADATAVADLNTTLRRTSDWMQALQASQSGGSMTLTRPTGWTEYFYFGGYWDSNTPVLTWHAGTSSAATVVLGNVSGAPQAVFAAANNRFIAIRIS